MALVSDVSRRSRPEPAAGEAPPEPSRPQAARRRLAVHPATAVVIGACAVLIRVGMAGGLSTDVFWHLASGQWMLAHHQVLRHDVLTYTVPGKRWVNAEWGFDVLLAWMVAHVGPVSYWVLSGGATAAALLAGVVSWRRRGAGNLWSAVIALLVAATLTVGVEVRPQDLSYLMFAAELLILVMARRRRVWLWVLPPLLLIWANTHGSFLAGVGIVGLEAMLSTVARLAGRNPVRVGRVLIAGHLRLGDAWAALAGVVAAACVNPHGPYLFLYDLRVSGSAQLNVIQEWQPPDFHDPVVLATIGVPVLVAVVAFALGRWRMDAFDLILWLGLLVLTLRAVRFAPYMGLALGGLLAGCPVLRRETIRPSLIAWPLGIVLAASILSLPHPAAGSPAVKGPLANPVRAANWLQHRPGRVFSTYAWNDYLEHVGTRVFVDGRTDMYFGTGILKKYLAVDGLTVNPDSVLGPYHVQWVLWPAHQPLSVYLQHDPTWRLARRFGGDLVFERRGPQG